MEIFKQLKKLGYKHYIDLTIEELDALSINDIKKRIEYSLVIDWLRNKNIIIEVRKNFPKNQYFYTIDSKTFQYVSESTFSYFEAREQAILKCIELCQNKKL